MSSNQAQISVLEFPECVQKRPGMYLPNITHAIFEIFDNGVDEHLAGYCDHITFESKGDNVFTITDNGRGIPITPHKDPKYAGLTQAEVAYTVLHAGGKFGTSSEGGYKTVTGGLHGVGASVVNALSEWLELTVCTEGKAYQARFEHGHIVSNMQLIGECPENLRGTQVQFKLSTDYWESDEAVKHKRIIKRFEQMSYLNPGLKISVDIDVQEGDKAIKMQKDFLHTDGIKAYVESLIKSREQISSVISLSDDTEFKVDIALAYSKSFSSEIYTFVNNINTEDGGDHLNGFKRGVSRIINKYALENGYIKENDKFDMSDTLEGIVAIVSIKVHEPKFDGQGKSKIRMAGVSGPVAAVAEKLLEDFLDKNPAEAKLVMDKILLAQTVRKKTQRAREAARKSKSLFEGRPQKFAPCVEKDPANCEIWIAEGRTNCSL